MVEKMKSVGEVEWLTPRELADRWRVSPDTIRRMIADKKLDAIKAGKRCRIHMGEIERYESGHKPKDADPINRPRRSRKASLVGRLQPLG